MIAAQDLRIGNYILYLNDLYVVTGMKEETAVRRLRVFFSTINGELKNAKLLNWIEPIPLTPEILKKITDFEMPSQILTLDKYFFLYNNYDGFWFQVEKQLETDYVCERFKIKCEYLHQLQNIYWCLCGKELEINL